MTWLAAALRRHSGLYNIGRNIGQWVLGHRVAASATIINDGAIVFGKGAIVSARCTISVPRGGKLLLGAGSWLATDVAIQVAGEISIGAETTVQRGSSLHGDVSIGRGCIIAPNLFASSGRHYFSLWPEVPIRLQDRRVSTDPLLASSHSHPIVIEDDCWLGVNVVLLPGITIGRGSVVGANAVVTKCVEPYSVVAGNPARLIRRRLQFEPKAALNGAAAEDAPYFYSGFELSDRTPPVADGSFVLAMDCRGASSIELRVRNLGASAAQISHHDTTRVIAGHSSAQLVFPLATEAAHAGRIRFENVLNARIEILEVRCLAGSGTCRRSEEHT